MKRLLLFYFLATLLFAEHSHTNALIDEDSPYLRQHAHNPVDWYPWGDEAFEKAQKENKLIFLSIGYSTCHWCHVMEEESFEDEEVAALLNRDYISIKVDREQFPQIDKKYQQLFKLLHRRSGGWPLSVFLTPQQKPFYVTTYIPKEEGYGSKGMMNLLPYNDDLFHNKPDKMQKMATAHEKIVKKGLAGQSQVVKFDNALMEKTTQEIEKSFDSEYGGFGRQPKFPEASKIALLLDIYRINSDPKVLSMARETLIKMAQSGLYDQIDGGFFRYTTDHRWQIPHFEKMLYTNAELIPLFVEIYEIDPNPLYLKVVRETIQEMDRRFMKSGLYFSASDADSDGEEGGYFIYDYRECVKGLKARGFSETNIKNILAYLGIEEDGNIDGDLSHVHITSQEVPKNLERAKSYLADLRKMRTFPFVDRKIITAWNAMMVKALFAAGCIDKKYIDEGRVRMKALLEKMSRGDRLYHQVLFGKKPEQAGVLEDYAFVVDALIQAHQATLDSRYLTLAKRFAKKAIVLFYRQGQWYMSSDGVGALADLDDKYYTSPLSTMISGLNLLAVLDEELKMNEIVSSTLKHYGKTLNNTPASAPKMMSVLLRHKVGNVVLKSRYHNLSENRVKIADIDYPFILLKSNDRVEYLACRLGTCFAEDGRLEPVILKIESEKELIGLDGKKRWR